LIDQHSGERYRVSTSIAAGTRSTARVKSYKDVLKDYEHHEGSKCADATGNPCSRKTVGLLGRRHILIDGTAFIGKESNKLEESEELLLTAASDVYTEYPDRKRDDWALVVLPRLKKLPLLDLMKNTGISRATLQVIRAGRRPHLRNEFKLRQALNSEA
jgi:hypothetical protein